MLNEESNIIRFADGFRRCGSHRIRKHYFSMRRYTDLSHFANIEVGEMLINIERLGAQNPLEHSYSR